MKSYNKRGNIVPLLKAVNNRRYRVEVSEFDSKPTTKDFTNLNEAIRFYNEQPHGMGISVRLCVLRPDDNGNWSPSNEYLLK